MDDNLTQKCTPKLARKPKVKLTNDLAAHIFALYLKGNNGKQIAAILAMNTTSVYKCLRKIEPDIDLRPRQHNHIDETGKTYGKLRVLSFSGLRYKSGGGGTREALFLCQCECGQQKIIAGGQLRLGRTVSCGCRKREILNAIHERNRERKRLKLAGS